MIQNNPNINFKAIYRLPNSGNSLKVINENIIPNNARFK